MNYALLSLLFTGILNACSQFNVDPINEYLALAPAKTVSSKNPQLKAFIDLYDHLDDKALEQQIAKAYAEKLFFNDTLVTFHERNNLLSYLTQTQQHLHKIDLHVLDIQEHGKDAYIRWQTETEFSALWKTHHVASVGMTHLRFNEQNQIVLQQDYWNSMQGFYQHIPVIGGVLHWINIATYA